MIGIEAGSEISPEHKDRAMAEAAEIALPIAGHCSCEAVRYRIDAKPIAVVACHCRQCRRQCGAAFSVNLIVPLKAMHVEGTLASYEDRATDSGVSLQRQFCPACGSPIRSLPGSVPGIAAVKAGTLDSPELFRPGAHIWTESAVPWLDLPEALPCFPRNASN